MARRHDELIRAITVEEELTRRNVFYRLRRGNTPAEAAERVLLRELLNLLEGLHTFSVC
jgi:hypothetical protein